MMQYVEGRAIVQFYTKNSNPNFNKYFYNCKIIRHKYWNPAFNIGGSNIVDFIQGKNLFVIGDNNIFIGSTVNQLGADVSKSICRVQNPGTMGMSRRGDRVGMHEL